MSKKENEKVTDSRVLLVKMTTGETVIGNVKTVDEMLAINFPHLIVPVADDPSRIQFVPWIYGVESMSEHGDGVQLNPVGVVAVVTPFKEMVDAYTEFKTACFSGITKPTKEETKLIMDGK